METTIKIPAEGRRSIEVLKAELALKGLGNVPTELKQYLRDDYCPFHRAQKLETVSEVYGGLRELRKCPKCGFSKPVIDISATTTADDVLKAVGVAALVLLGIYALSKILGK